MCLFCVVNNESAGESIGGDVMTSQEEESISFPSQGELII